MRVRRSIGTAQLRNWTPLLMFDHFSSESGGSDDAGAPDHPHRGQETITYILQGGADHEDFTEGHGTLDAGDLQFMTAGRGIMHSEMPREELVGEPVVGLQLWVDLLKYCEPRYRDLKAAKISQTTTDGGKVHVKAISSQAFGVQSPRDLTYTPVWYLDFFVKPGGKLQIPLPQGWNAFCYVLKRSVIVVYRDRKQPCPRFSNTVFEKVGDSVSIPVDTGAEQDARFLVIAGLPLY